jgi:hypothetical protein
MSFWRFLSRLSSCSKIEQLFLFGLHKQYKYDILAKKMAALAHRQSCGFGKPVSAAAGFDKGLWKVSGNINLLESKESCVA